MNQGKKFCTGCGMPLAAGDRFCGSCGKPLVANTATPTAPFAPVFAAAPSVPPPSPVIPASPAAMEEAIVGVIPAASRKKGLMGVEGFNIIVTRRRMIFAIMTNDMIKDEVKKAGKEGGFLVGMLNAATVGYTFYKRYLVMAPDEALAENPQNFAVDLSRVKKVKIEAGKEIKNYYTNKADQNSIVKQHQYEKGKLVVETIGDTYYFELPGSSQGMALDIAKKAGLA